jgi:hypothetical protein
LFLFLKSNVKNHVIQHVFEELVVYLQRQNINNMSRTNATIEMLQYQLRRYKAMKKGAACQSLQFKIQRLMSQAHA